MSVACVKRARDPERPASQKNSRDFAIFWGNVVIQPPKRGPQVLEGTSSGRTGSFLENVLVVLHVADGRWNRVDEWPHRQRGRQSTLGRASTCPSLSARVGAHRGASGTSRHVEATRCLERRYDVSASGSSSDERPRSALDQLLKRCPCLMRLVSSVTWL